MAQAVINIGEYEDRIINIVKGKYGLKNKSEALNKFALLFGHEYVEPEVREEVINEIINSCNAHVKKYGMRKMSLAELKELTGAD